MRFKYLFPFLFIAISCGKITTTFEGKIPLRNPLPGFYDRSNVCDLDSLLNQSKVQNKPVLLYFTGYGCVNNRKMEDNIFCYEDVHDLMHKDFIPWALYIDDKTELTATHDDRLTGLKKIKTIGDDNIDIQTAIFKKNIQPYIIILRSDKSIVGEIGYTSNKKEFKDFLLKTRNNF